jgi:hypothetical protein
MVVLVRLTVGSATYPILYKSELTNGFFSRFS